MVVMHFASFIPTAKDNIFVEGINRRESSSEEIIILNRMSQDRI